ncbi:MAG: DNA replication/repair protein RecF [Silicimonas sp.]|nr:DNA replication/repair protein RecF [Silicimonas sp.]
MSVVADLSLSHFRSHRTTNLAVDPRPVAIFGANGAGKTNILEAVSLLSPGRGLRRAQAEELIRRPEALGWKITSILTGTGAPNEVETSANPGSSRAVRIDGKAQPQIALGKIARVVWLVPAMDRLWIEGAEGRRRFLDRIAMSFEPSHAEAVLTYEKGMRERNRLLKDMVRDAHWYTALERQMADSAAKVTANRRAALSRLSQAAKGAQTAFPAATLSITHAQGPLPDDADALAKALAENRSADMRAGRTLIGPHRIDLNALFAAKGVPAAQCSTGEQKALLISLVLTNARALAEDTGAPPLILLDEVAAHLDADRRAALYDEIAALGAQAWMTGTGPELFGALGERAQYIDVTEENGESRATLKDRP